MSVLVRSSPRDGLTTTTHPRPTGHLSNAATCAGVLRSRMPDLGARVRPSATGSAFPSIAPGRPAWSHSIAGPSGPLENRSRCAGSERMVPSPHRQGGPIPVVLPCSASSACPNGFPAGCRSGSVPSPHGTACRGTPRSPLTVPWVADGGLVAMVAAISCARLHRSSGRPPPTPDRSGHRGVGADPFVVAHQRDSQGLADPILRINLTGSSAQTRSALTWESKNVASGGADHHVASLTK